VPNLETTSSKRRSHRGDLLAVLLLLAILAGLGWLWRHGRQPAPRAQSAPPAVHRVVPSLVVVERMPEAPVIAPAKEPESAPPAPLVAPMIASNLPPPVAPVVAPVVVPAFPRPVQNLLEAQIALARLGISPGSIDGAIGSQTRAALAVFQRLQNLVPTSGLDTNTQTLLKLQVPLLTDYVVTSNDLARLQPLGRTWLAKSRQSALDYETILQLVAEKAHSHPALIERLNPDTVWTDVHPGTVLKIPDVAYPEPADKAAFVVIHLSDRYLEAFGTDSNLLAHFPCSIGAKFDKRPVGELHVAVIAAHPNYTFDPAIFPESPEAQAIGHKLILPPGPKNPVGVAWIGLDKPGYGMHGTPAPEQIGHTGSHGCFRLANWDAEYLLKLAWIGMPVFIEP
jgi:lipoprotein-anchoring transpeptidase ErfK/SrfK